jgi:transcription factor IIIB subunit 2
MECLFVAKGERVETGASNSKSRKVRIPLATKTFFFASELAAVYLSLLICSGIFLHSNTRSSLFFMQRRKTSNKPRDASTPSGSTAAESVRNLIKKNPRYSKRINYDALKDLFVDADDEKDNDGLYTIDQRNGDMDADGMDIIEEEGGAVGVVAGKEKEKEVGGEETDGNLDEDADGEEEGSDKGEEVIDTGWEDVYEQEV